MVSKLMEKYSKRELITKFIVILVGNILSSIAFNVFFIPNKLLSGGVGGIAIIIQYLTGIPTGISVFCLIFPYSSLDPKW